MAEGMMGKKDMNPPASHHCHLLLGGALLLLLVSSGLSCPARCECSAQSKSVSCHRKRLASIPEGIPIESRVLDLSLTNLTRLDLSHNRLVVLLDHAFQDLRRLSSLEVGDNELVFVSQRAFTGLLGLQSLTLERSNLTVIPTDALAHLHSLVELRMRHLSISFLKPFSFKRLSRLRHLEIDYWPWLDTLPPLSLHGLNLTSLYITNTNLSAFPGAALRSLPYLTHLNLSFCRIRHIQQGELGELPYLLELRLQGSQLLSVEPFAFTGLKSLQLLDVSHNRLDSLEREVFGSPDSLQRLCLGGNPLVCDCRMLWLLNSHKPPSLHILDVQPECSAPEHLHGKSLRELREPLVSRYMTCTKPRIGPNTHSS
ncbi:hypothetical protein WMY93_017227 [Mugilogobius chulae]|uniref:LRRCT domain-containing protein n=1 Tax=Mugilogobius chulae TaxID=88201 RepID=A0AAW0NMN0_9GOBI